MQPDIRRTLWSGEELRHCCQHLQQRSQRLQEKCKQLTESSQRALSHAQHLQQRYQRFSDALGSPP